MVIVGAIAFFQLPVTEYLEIAPPQINITARYPGANAETIARTVATPSEQEINGVENMLYMSSYSTADGRSEEHTSELQSLMRISYAVCCLKKNTNNTST